MKLLIFILEVFYDFACEEEQGMSLYSVTYQSFQEIAVLFVRSLLSMGAWGKKNWVKRKFICTKVPQKVSWRL